MVASLDIQGTQYTAESIENISDPVDEAIKKVEFHPSILLIQKRIDKTISQNLLGFHEVTKVEVLKDLYSIKHIQDGPFCGCSQM